MERFQKILSSFTDIAFFAAVTALGLADKLQGTFVLMLFAFYAQARFSAKSNANAIEKITNAFGSGGSGTSGGMPAIQERPPSTFVDVVRPPPQPPPAPAHPTSAAVPRPRKPAPPIPREDERWGFFSRIHRRVIPSPSGPRPRRLVLLPR